MLRCQPVSFLALIAYAVVCLARIDVYFSWGIAGYLTEVRLITAAQCLLRSFPVLGAKLDLTSAPALRLQDASFPVSFADWPSGSAEQLFGPVAAPPVPNLPV